MEAIKYKIAMDEKGTITGVELWQGNQHITLSMSGGGTHRNGCRWTEVKDFMDNLNLPSISDSETHQIMETFGQKIREEE